MAQRLPIAQSEPWQRLDHEPEHIVLPVSGPSVARVPSETLPALYNKLPPPSYTPRKPFFSERSTTVVLALVCIIFLLVSSSIAFNLIGSQPSIASPTVSATPDMVHIGGMFTLSGQGFGARHLLTFTYGDYGFRQPFLDERQRPLLVHAMDDGQFSVQLHVPTDWAVGQHTIYVLDQAQDLSSSTTVTVHL